MRTGGFHRFAFFVASKPVIKFFEDLDILVRLDATKDMCETLKELEKELGLGEIDDNN